MYNKNNTEYINAQFDSLSIKIAELRAAIEQSSAFKELPVYLIFRSSYYFAMVACIFKTDKTYLQIYTVPGFYKGISSVGFFFTDGMPAWAIPPNDYNNTAGGLRITYDGHTGYMWLHSVDGPKGVNMITDSW